MNVNLKSVAKAFLLLILLSMIAFSLIGRPGYDAAAAPQEQQAIDQVWFDQAITTSGVTAIVESGAAGQWTVFLHLDTPGAAESYTMTIGGRAIIGTTIYTSPNSIVFTAHDTTTAVNYYTHTTYTGGEMWPQHYVTVNSRNAAGVGDLLWVQKQ